MSVVYPKCTNCKQEVTDYIYEHAKGRLCKLCYLAANKPREFEFRGNLMKRLREGNKK